MITVAVLLAAATTSPLCPAPVGDPVAITSTPLPVEKLGGSESTSETYPFVGQLRYHWGVMLRSDDSRFVHLRYHRGQVYSESSGCWFRWDMQVAHSPTKSANGRIGEAIFNSSYVEHEPAYWPDIPGYRFITAKEVHVGGYAWLGVWNAEGVTERSKIIVYDGQRHTVLATLPLRIGGIDITQEIHTVHQWITLIGEGKPAKPVPWFQVSWLGR